MYLPISIIFSGQYFGSPDLSPPYLQETKKQYIFNPDLGRTLELTLANKNTKIRGTTGYEYKMDSLFFQFGYMKVDTSEKQFLTSGRAISIKMIFPNVSPLMHQIL